MLWPHYILWVLNTLSFISAYVYSGRPKVCPLPLLKETNRLPQTIRCNITHSFIIVSLIYNGKCYQSSSNQAILFYLNFRTFPKHFHLFHSCLPLVNKQRVGSRNSRCWSVVDVSGCLNKSWCLDLCDDMFWWKYSVTCFVRCLPVKHQCED